MDLRKYRISLRDSEVIHIDAEWFEVSEEGHLIFYVWDDERSVEFEIAAVHKDTWSYVKEVKNTD